MAGHDPNFDPDVFRAAIKATMHMGVPTDPDEQLIWHFKNVKTYAAQDPSLKPYDWTAPPAIDVPGDPDAPAGQLVVDYALEFAAQRNTDNTIAGAFDSSHLVVTLLDVDFDLIKTADYATIGRVYYQIDFSGPPMGLFEVTTHQIYLTARDQS